MIVFAFMIKYCIVLCRMQMGIMGQIHHAAAARGEKGETASYTDEGEDGSRPTRLRQSEGRPAAAYPGSTTTTRLLLLLGKSAQSHLQRGGRTVSGQALLST